MDYRVLENSILKGAKFLLDLQNPDGGIKFADENSDISGVWVTAETLEFFLQSKVIPMTCYEQVKRMIVFLLDSQKENGAWPVLANTVASSTVTTGHSIYVLKLSLAGGFAEKLLEERIFRAIQSGEEWLRRNVANRTRIAFWGAENKIGRSFDPNKDESSRMEFIFTTYYALLGLVDPPLYMATPTNNVNIIKKVYHFFCDQAEWFVNKYTSATNIDKLEIFDFAKIASTISRVINGLTLINRDISDTLLIGLKKIVELCAQSSYMATSISINTQKVGSSAETYNNNTPFDMGMAFISLNTDADFIAQIIQEYLEHQETGGYWFLNFRSSYKWNTWTTSEALIFIETALKKYIDIRNNEIMDVSKKKVKELEDQIKIIEQEYNNRLKELKKVNSEQVIEIERALDEQNVANERIKNARNHTKFMTIISCALSVMLCIALIYISQQISKIYVAIANILNMLIIPLVVNMGYDILKTVRISKD